MLAAFTISQQAKQRPLEGNQPVHWRGCVMNVLAAFFGILELVIVAGIVTGLLCISVVCAIMLSRQKAGADGGQPTTEPTRLSALAVSAFVAGVLGVFPNCLVLPPIALLLAFLASRRIKQFPGSLRGHWAVITAVILGCCGLVISALLVAIPIASGHAARRGTLRSAQQAVQRADERVKAFADQHGTLPDDEEGALLLKDERDPWDNPVVYERTDDLYQVVCFGPDGELDTEDDVCAGTYWETVTAGDQ